MRKSGLSLAVALLVCGGNAFAQEDRTIKDVKKVDEITVVSATGFEQNIVDAPASISVITSKEIEKASYENIKDVLKNLSSVVVSDTNLQGNKDISIRGMHPKYTLTMINGKPVSGREVGGIFSDGINIQTLPPLNMIERIEVIRGPMSSLYGSEAVGGMINIITKKVSNEWAASVSGQYNMFQNRDTGAHYNIGTYVSGPLIKDALGLELNTLWSKKEEDQKDGNEERSLEGRNISKNIGGKLSLMVTDRDTVRFEYQYSKNDVLHHNDISDWDKSGNYKKDVFVLDHEGKYDKLTLQTYLKYDKSNFFGTLISNPSFILGGDLNTLMFNTQGSYSFDKHILSLGFNYLNERMDNVIFGKTKRWNSALFAEDDFFITNDLIFTLGARINKNERYGTHFAPRAYVVYHLNDTFTLKGGVSTGYINPDLTVSSKSGYTEHGRGVAAAIGDPNIKPESSINYEAGFAYNDEKINFSLMGFYFDFKDKIDRVRVCRNGVGSNPATWTCTVPSGKKYLTVSKYVNEASLYNAGVELSFDYQILSNLDFKSNYTYTKSKYKKGENKGVKARDYAEHVANFGLDYSPIDKLSLWTNISYNHKEKDIDEDTPGKPSYTVADLGLAYKVNNHLNLNAGIYNITNTNPKYISWGSSSEFVEGRKFMLGFNANF